MRWYRQDQKLVELRPTGERLDPGLTQTSADHLLLRRHLFAYQQVPTFAAPPGLALDIGCGTGYGTAMLSGFGFDSIGLDLDQAVLDSASARYGSERCRFIRLEATEFPVPSGTVDLVVAFQVIEHVLDPLAFIEEIRRVARPGATILLTTPNRELRLDPGAHPWNRYHLREYDVAGFESLFGSGFSAAKVLGIDAGSQARNIELDRVATLRRLARLDPWRLRRFIPQSIIRLVVSALGSGAQDRSQTIDDPGFVVVPPSADPLDLLVVATV